MLKPHDTRALKIKSSRRNLPLSSICRRCFPLPCRSCTELDSVLGFLTSESSKIESATELAQRDAYTLRHSSFVAWHFALLWLLEVLPSLLELWSFFLPSLKEQNYIKWLLGLAKECRNQTNSIANTNSGKLSVETRPNFSNKNFKKESGCMKNISEAVNIYPYGFYKSTTLQFTLLLLLLSHVYSWAEALIKES